MINSLFINSCILISALFVTSQIFDNSTFYPKSILGRRILIGILGGMLGAVLMFYSVDVSEHVIFDFRHIAQLIVAASAGFLPVLITSIIMAAFRLLYFGINNQSIITAGGIVLIGIGCGIISKLHIPKLKQWVAMSVYSTLTISIIIISILKYSEVVVKVVALLWLGTALLGVVVFYLLEYLDLARKLLLRLKQESTVDFLTGLNNTRSFDYLFNMTVEDIKNSGESLAMLMIDIDFFKKVNDTYGHTSGDIVLRDLGQLLLNACRASDIVARIGGEEFTVIIRGMSAIEVKNAAERIRSQVENNVFHLPGKDITLTISIGVAIYPETVKSIDALKEAGDNKLYEAKRTGRNKVCI